MPSFEVSPELLASIAGVVLSLVFSFTPGLNVKFAALVPEVKRLIMLGLLFLVSAGVYAGTCTGILSSGITCDQSGILRLIWIFIAALMANQSTYTITPKTENVTKAASKAKEAEFHGLNG